MLIHRCQAVVFRLCKQINDMIRDGKSKEIC